ncbi:uncharacterized protein [Palaemon carinicauda]|uniref:uncharacterized protein n=1 Tax=Palaemon carinicauda TaxID=392227 RepID=UPI0035B63C60
MAWIDYKKAFDSLFPLLFVVAILSMSKVLQKMDVGYQLKKRGNRINHLMLMDDIELYGKSIKEMDTLVQNVRIVSGDTRRKFGIGKCALVNIQKGKVTRTEGIKLPDGSNIKHIDEKGYKYLGIMERGNIKLQEMKVTIRKEYMQRFKTLLKSKLNARNFIKAITTLAVPVIRYSAGIVEWTKAELRSINLKTRKHANTQSTTPKSKYRETICNMKGRRERTTKYRGLR